VQRLGHAAQPVGGALLLLFDDGPGLILDRVRDATTGLSSLLAQPVARTFGTHAGRLVAGSHSGSSYVFL
jgi:hypothetical protein